MAIPTNEVVSQIFNFRALGAHSSGATISSATVLTIPAGASGILIQTFTQNVRYTLDGTIPTSAVGFQLKAADPPVFIPLDSDVIFTVIEEAATAVLQYQFLRAK